MRGHISQPRRDHGRGAARRGLRDLRGRQVAPVPDGGGLGGRPVRPVAAASGASTASTGSSTARPTSSPPTSSTTTTASTRPATRRGRLPPQRGPGRPGDRLHPRHRRRSGPTGRSSPTSRSAPPTRRTRRRPSTSRSTAAGSTRAGTSPASAGSPASRSSGSSRAGTELAPRNPGRGRGTTCPRTSGGSRLACRRRSPRSSTTPTPRSAGSSTRSSALGQLDNTVIVLLVGQRRQPGGRPVRRPARDEVLQLHPRDARRGDRPPRRHRRAAQPHQLPVGLGPGRQHPVQVVQAEHPRGRRPRAAASCTGRPASPTRGGLRDQFHHVTDIAPTIYEAARRRRRPTVYRGVDQLPVTGTSMRYTLRRARRRAQPQDGAVLRDDGPPRPSTPTAGRR